MGEKLDPPSLEAWDPWQPSELFLRLRAVDAPWHVAGGWALDLWHGFETRRYEDVEIAILRSDFAVFRRTLAGMELFCAGSGQVWRLSPDESPPDSIHQVWCLDADSGRWKLDIMLEPGTADKWEFRRDGRISRRRAEMIGWTVGGVPFLKPAGVLIFKAKHRRIKDERDFENVIRKLDANERGWLKTALKLAHRGHEWIARL